MELGATFVARSFSGDKTQLVPMIKAAMSHPGFAFIDVHSEEDIGKAVDALNGKEIGERKLRVSKSLDKDQIRSKKGGRFISLANWLSVNELIV